MSVTLRALVLPAFDDLGDLPSEAEPWRRAYDFDQLPLAGLSSPLWYTEAGLGLVPTGVGKAAAATTTAAICASEEVVLEEPLVCSVGVAGGPPSLPIGSVVIADHIVDWDDKCRFDPGEDPLALNPYTDRGAFELDPGLVSRAESLADGVELAGPEDADGPSAGDSDSGPVVVTGTNLCGDELWHGRGVAAQASWLVSERGCGPYLATEMEDSGTAAALERFGLADRYLSIRGISNHDRPSAGESARESFFSSGFEAGFETGLSNAVAVARAVVGNRVS